MELIDPQEAFLAAKKAADDARAALLARLDELDKEREATLARIVAEKEKIHAALRTRPFVAKPRKPKGAAPEAKKVTA